MIDEEQQSFLFVDLRIEHLSIVCFVKQRTESNLGSEFHSVLSQS
jgi:hypothetical protein